MNVYFLDYKLILIFLSFLVGLKGCFYFIHVQGLYSSVPEMASQLLAHEHVHSQHHGGHHHGMDMDHPILALNMTILSIGVKEG